MKKLLIALFVSLSLAACDGGSGPYSSEGQAVQQAPSHSTGDMLLGGFLGYMLGRSSSPAPSTHVVEHHHYSSTPSLEKKVVSEQQKPHAAQTVVKPSTPVITTPAPKVNQYATASSGVKSYSGSTNSYARSSYSSSYSSSRSFSSGRR